jgi:chromosome segregation ATPase
MSENHEQQSEFSALTSGTPRWVGLAVAVLAGVSLLALGVSWNAISRARNAEQSSQAALKQSVDQLNQRLAKADDVNQQVQSDLRVVTDKLQLTQEQLITARKQTKAVSSEYNKKLTGLESSVKSDLATKASAEDVKNLSGDVTGVKNDLDATKGSIQMARSELGTLIARNHEEIDQLRRMGQRDYFEFTLPKKASPQRVGSIQIQLRDTNVKKNRYTIVVLADDKSFEKKDRSVNEPIFFYTGGTRAALELVINKVTRDQATGYLSIPKSATQPNAASANTGF